MHQAYRYGRLPALLLALQLLSCAHTAPVAAPNKYGLSVVEDIRTYRAQVAADSSKKMLDLGTVQGLSLDLRYAGTNNFMKRQLYGVPRAFLRAPAAVALSAANALLAREGLGIKVYDAYRPYSVTEIMWEPYKNPDYVADPAKGSRHNRGAAVDVTLIDLKTGEELEMPTAYDDFTPRAGHAFIEGLSEAAIANRARLLDLMQRHGFEPLASEWWHYDYKGWREFELMNVPLEKLP